MNTSRNLLVAAVAAISLAAVASSANAQASATANGSASATILKPIKLTAVTPLSFGKLASDTAAAGKTTIAIGADALSGTNKLYPTPNNSATRAKFTINGEANQAYTITLPTTDVAMSGTGVKLTTFTSTSPVLDGTDQDLYVGATLEVDAGAGGGSRTATFPVTVAYN